MEDLKKCPFCGGEADIEKIIGFSHAVIAAYVYCKECGASTQTYGSEEVAYEAWNRRRKSEQRL